MNLKAFYAAILLVLATVAALSVTWEFWLEDLLVSAIVGPHPKESDSERWEFVVTTVIFSAIALIGPGIMGGRMIRRDRLHRDAIVRLSQEDHLTGLLNRRRITELLANEIHRAVRYRTRFSVMLMDIDHFKEVNDRFGHQAGDDVLARIATIIRSRVRTTDRVGRWGGEEFLILSPETEIGGSSALAEEIRTRLASADLGPIGHRTASFGVTAYIDGDDIEAIIARADAGLYAAKQHGRNRVEMMPGDAT